MRASTCTHTYSSGNTGSIFLEVCNNPPKPWESSLLPLRRSFATSLGYKILPHHEHRYLYFISPWSWHSLASSWFISSGFLLLGLPLWPCQLSMLINIIDIATKHPIHILSDTQVSHLNYWITLAFSYHCCYLLHCIIAITKNSNHWLIPPSIHIPHH